MSVKLNNRIQWYLRISRMLGVFPLSQSKDGTLKISLCSLPTIISITLAGLYTVAMLDLLYSRLNEHTLSYRLTSVPTLVAAILTDYLIRVSSIRYSNDLIKFLGLMDSSTKQNCGSPGLMRYLGTVSTVYAVFKVIRLIVSLIVFPENHISLATVNKGFFVEIISFGRNGTNWSALCFVTLFGEQVIARFESLCKEIMEYCGTRAVSTCADGTVSVLKPVQHRLEASGLNMLGLASGKELTGKITELNIAFSIYTKIGGAFIFALLVDIWAWAFYLICAVLFGHGDSSSQFIFILRVIESIMATLTLLTVAEVGHEIANRV